jgi:hypothetical protein
MVYTRVPIWKQGTVLAGLCSSRPVCRPNNTNTSTSIFLYEKCDTVNYMRLFDYFYFCNAIIYVYRHISLYITYKHYEATGDGRGAVRCQGCCNTISSLLHFHHFAIYFHKSNGLNRKNSVKFNSSVELPPFHKMHAAPRLLYYFEDESSVIDLDIIKCREAEI